MRSSGVLSSSPVGVRGWRGVARRAPLTAFFGLAFGLTWVYHLVVLGLLHAAVVPWAIPGTFGPAVAGFLMVWAVDGREGVRDLRRRLRKHDVGVRWYLLGGVGLPLLVVACGLFLPGGLDAFAKPAGVIVVTYLVQLVVIFFGGGGLNEEPGWRGFALPRLQRTAGPLKGSLVLGVLWGIWHVSLYVYTPGYNGAGSTFASAAPMFLAFLVCTTALSVLFTWLYNSTGGSVFYLAFVHASFNAGSMWAPGTSRYMLIVFGMTVVVALAVLLGTRGRLGWEADAGAAGADAAGAGDMRTAA